MKFFHDWHPPPPPFEWCAEVPVHAVKVCMASTITSKNITLIIQIPVSICVIYIIFHCELISTTSQQKRDIDPMLYQCCSTVYDAGPTFVQHWVDVLCLLGCLQWPIIMLVISGLCLLYGSWACIYAYLIYLLCQLHLLVRVAPRGLY